MTKICTGPNCNVAILFFVTDLSKVQSRGQFLKVTRGMLPIKGSFGGPGGNFLDPFFQKKRNMITVNKTILKIIF
jgi:hypothetical protein